MIWLVALQLSYGVSYHSRPRWGLRYSQLAEWVAHQSRIHLEKGPSRSSHNLQPPLAMKLDYKIIIITSDNAHGEDFCSFWGNYRCHVHSGLGLANEKRESDYKALFGGQHFSGVPEILR
jgi:hypothetical protein